MADECKGPVGYLNRCQLPAAILTMAKTVCILTTAHSPYDDRIDHREAVSLARAGYHAPLMASWHQSELTPDGIRIIAVAKAATRLGRFARTSARLFKIALSQSADVYHFHDPDLLPWMLVLSAMKKRVIYDVHEYNARIVFLSKSWLPAWSRRLVSSSVERLEKFSARHFAGIITVNEHMRHLFRPYNANVVSIANYPLSCLDAATPGR